MGRIKETMMCNTRDKWDEHGNEVSPRDDAEGHAEDDAMERLDEAAMEDEEIQQALADCRHRVVNRLSALNDSNLSEDNLDNVAGWLITREGES